MVTPTEEIAAQGAECPQGRRAESAAIQPPRPGAPAWVRVLLVLAAALGVVLGLIAQAGAAGAIIVLGVVQVAVSLALRRAATSPIVWALAVAATCVVSAFVVSRDFAASGGLIWVGLATLLAAHNLYRFASSPRSLIGGSAALATGLVGVVVASVGSGVPVAAAILAASIHVLVGVILAMADHVRDARADALRSPERAVAAALVPDRGGELVHARRALAIVALRSDELADSSDDTATRRAAVDLREVARRGLAGQVDPGAVPHDDIVAGSQGSRGEPEPAPGSESPTSPASSGPAASAPTPEEIPVLDDREREILRLLITGASNAAIARQLYLSEATVKQQVSRLMRRFDRANRTQLALLAVRWLGE